MFHISITTQYSLLPEPDQLSELDINFIKECLMIDPVECPSVLKLMNYMWMFEFCEALISYEEAKNATCQAADISIESPHESSSTTVKQAALLLEDGDHQVFFQCFYVGNPASDSISHPLHLNDEQNNDS